VRDADLLFAREIGDRPRQLERPVERARAFSALDSYMQSKYV